MTVERNLQLGAYRRHDGRVREDLQRVLEYFPALSDKLQREAGTLSGGEQQMVAIGRGLMARPKLLMIDEPSLGLAPKIVDRVMEVVKTINQDGTAVLLVEQDVHARAGDRRPRLRAGERAHGDGRSGGEAAGGSCRSARRTWAFRD